MTHKTAEWISAEVSAYLPIPVDVSPEVVAFGSLIVLVSVSAVAIAIARVMTMLVARRKFKHNRLIVQMADHAPEDDGDEHELEKHSSSRAAAPGDSDYEDDALATPSKNSLYGHEHAGKGRVVT